MHRRAVAWLQRRNLVDAQLDGLENQEQTSLDACAAVAMHRGAVRALRDGADASGEAVGMVEAPPREDAAVDLPSPWSDSAGCPTAASPIASRSFATAARSTA